MSNIKVTLRQALEPSRSEHSGAELMTVTAIEQAGAEYRHRLVGDRKTLLSISSRRYAVGDKVIVSGGQIVGKSKKAELVVWV